MPIYTLTQNPKKIQNLLYWFDASDSNSLSLTAIGSATASVVSIRDKVSGVTLTNFGSQQPWYYYNRVNSKNSIYFLSQLHGITTLRSNSCTFSSIGSIYTVTKWGLTQSGDVFYNRAISIQPSSRGNGTTADFALGYRSINAYSLNTTVGPAFSAVVGQVFGISPSGNNSSVDSVGIDVFATRYTPGFTKVDQINTYGVKSQYMNVTYSITSSSNSLVIGNYHASSANLTGYVGNFCEFIYFNRFLNERENNQILQYLRSKWLGR